MKFSESSATLRKQTADKLKAIPLELRAKVIAELKLRTKEKSSPVTGANE